MPMPTSFCYLGITELAGQIRSRVISAVEATQRALGRIDALDGQLHSFALVTPELALEQAHLADADIKRGNIKGPLHGVPIAVKDLCWTKGTPTAAGMTIYRDFRPDADATVVRKLRDAGAVLLGKLQTTESAYAEHHPDIIPPVNPWNAAHWTGVSSSGSGVATAAGLCYGSLGSDTGGSIRFPSAANGVTGVKPTWGRVSRYGVFELAATLDHIGPMTRNAVDAAAMLGVIAGPDDNDPTASPEPVPNYLAGIRSGLRGLRVGIDPKWNESADAPTLAALAATVDVIGDLGCELIEVRFPDATQVVREWYRHCAVQTALAHAGTYPERKSEYGPGLADLITAGRDVSGLEYQQIILHAKDFTGRLAALFEQIDLLVAPVQPFASPTLETMAELGKDQAMVARLISFTSPFDVAGTPTITLPCGMTNQNTPIGFQFAARPFEEALLCRAGYAFQQATDWHQSHPTP
jgi:amidase